MCAVYCCSPLKFSEVGDVGFMVCYHCVGLVYLTYSVLYNQQLVIGHFDDLKWSLFANRRACYSVFLHNKFKPVFQVMQ